jgi:energy-coupling factor transporter ATP-binding protein EcfA2
MANRAEFSKSVRTVIAERAGYQCSVLNCGRLTLGPSPNGRNVLRTGMAAHIYAAAPGGPRGTGGLSAEERSEPENGIWCCYTHGKAIDSDPTGIYSAAQLRAWKRLHEARKGAEVTGITSDNYGLVESITVESAPAALAGRKFPLGMRNIITGPNGSGKSILARLIASVAYPDHVAEMSKWREVDFAVKWFDPHTHDVATSGRAGEVWHVLDGEKVPYVARPYKTIFLPADKLPSLDSVARLAQLLDLSTVATKALLRSLPESCDLAKEVTIIGDHIEWTTELDGRIARSTRLDRLSRGWQSLMLIELAGAHARHHARVEPTILLLDEPLGYASETAITERMLERLETVAEHAQVAVVSVHPDAMRSAESWTVTELGDRPIRHIQGSPIEFEVQATTGRPNN